MLEFSRPKSVLLRERDVWTGQESFPDFDDWCARHRGSRCAVWASAAHVHDVMLDIDAPARGDRQVLEWARAQWLQYHGEGARGWSLAAWSHGGRRGVSALHGLALGALLSTARAQRVRVTTVRPWWSRMLSDALDETPRMRRGPARLVVVEGTYLTRLDLLNAQLQTVEADRLDSPDLRELVLRQAEWPNCPTWTVGYGLAGLGGLRDGAQAT